MRASSLDRKVQATLEEIFQHVHPSRVSGLKAQVESISDANSQNAAKDSILGICKLFGFLAEDSHPDERSSLPSEGRGRHSGVGELVHVHRGIQVRRVSADWLKWRGDGGVYVGKGCEGLSGSLFHEAFRECMDPSLVRGLLKSRPLYVGAREPVNVAIEVLDFFNVANEPSVSDVSPWVEYHRHFEVLLRGKLSVSHLGVALKELIRLRPSSLGLCQALLEICAIGTLGGKLNCRELLPMRLPPDTAAEKCVLGVLHSLKSGSSVPARELAEVKTMMYSAGVDGWTWIQVLLVDYLYLGRERVLGHCMVHNAEWTDAQREVLKVFQRNARLFCEGDPTVAIGPWHEVSEPLGDLYSGKEWRKCYKLTWAAIRPSVPKPGEAARISLTDVLPERLQKYSENPDLIRIPDDEVINGRHSAPVHVESQEEWDRIVHELCRAGMFEAEVEGETVHWKGEPVLNGAFGVHKAWKEVEPNSWIRVLRLIINLIPTNSLQRRLPERASSHMSYGPLFGQMVVQEDEVCLFAEDQKHCFHVYRPGYKWRGYFVLSRKASAASFGLSGEGRRPRVCSAPMGWKNVVDLIQVAHERMGSVAGVPPSHLLRLGYPLPQSDLKSPREWFSIFVDNFDQTLIVAESEAGVYMGTASDAQLKLRQVYDACGVEREPAKAAEGVLQWSTLGAEQRQGLIGSSLDFRRALLGGTLHLLRHEGGGKVRAQEMLTTVSKHMHSTQYNRPLACIFNKVFQHIALERSPPLDTNVADELWLLLMALPAHWMNTKAKLDHRAWATDASEEGGGACHSVQISKVGEARAHLLAHDVECIGGSPAAPILVVEVYGGVGGLSRALQLLGIVPMGLIFVDSNARARKLEKAHMPFALFYSKIEELTQEEVSRWRVMFRRVERVLLVGGWPQSRGDFYRLDKMLDVRRWLQEAPARTDEPPWSLIELYECVTLDPVQTQVANAKIGCRPLHVKCEEFGWCCRTQQVWLRGLDVIPGQDLTLIDVEDPRTGLMHVKVGATCTRPSLSLFLNPGVRRYTRAETPWPCFVKPFKRGVAPQQDHTGAFASAKAQNRWRADAFRVPPYMYEDDWMVTDRGGPRRLKAIEQARMLGFGSTHFDGLKPTPSEDEMGQFVAAAFPVLFVARLLVGLAASAETCRSICLLDLLWDVWQSREKHDYHQRHRTWSEKFGPQAGCVPEACSLRELLGMRPIPSPACLADPAQKLSNEQFLILNYLRLVSHRGSDVRFDTGVPYSPHELARRPIDPSSWIWKVFLSYRWKQSGHINVLEAAAVLDLLRKLAKNPQEMKFRRLLLIDNQSVLGVLAKGRSSSQALQAPLTRISALLVATETKLILGWVQSALNPADGPSRWRHAKL